MYIVSTPKDGQFKVDAITEVQARKEVRKLLGTDRLPRGTMVIKTSSTNKVDEKVSQDVNELGEVDVAEEENVDDSFLDIDHVLFGEDENEEELIINESDPPIVKFKKTIKSKEEVDVRFPDGACGQNKAECLYVEYKQDEVEKELDGLDATLRHYWPDITLLEYKLLLQTIQIHDKYVEFDFETGPDGHTAYKLVYIDKLFHYLLTKGKIEMKKPIDSL